jgi:hypothetical protein
MKTLPVVSYQLFAVRCSRLFICPSSLVITRALTLATNPRLANNGRLPTDN